MTRQELEHAIRAVCDLTGEREVYVFGSQAILAQFPNAPSRLRQSAEADIALKNHPEKADLVDGALGELSIFHNTHGFYVHGLTLDAATLPQGWEGRTQVIKNANTRNNTGYCVEAHDLAASKLYAYRDKDRSFVRAMLTEGLLEPDGLNRSLDLLPIPTDRRTQLIAWVNATVKELNL